MWFCCSGVFLGLQTRTRPSTGFSKNLFSSDQCTLWQDLTFHPIWSRAHCSLAALWRRVSCGRFIGLLARSLALLRRLLTVRLLMRPLTIQFFLRVFAVLNESCLASLFSNRSSLGVVFTGLPVRWRSLTSPVSPKRCNNRTITEWLTHCLKNQLYKTLLPK
jgi:hypothetical protein